MKVLASILLANPKRMDNQTLNHILLAIMALGLGLVAFALVRQESKRQRKSLERAKQAMSVATKPRTKSIEVLLPDKSTVEGKLLLWDCDPENTKIRRITLRFSGKELSTVDTTYWGALNKIRFELDAEKILLKCYGCSRNVWPSGMGLSMGTGGIAYKIFPAKKGDRKDLVSIFDSGLDVDPCTFNEQKEFHEQWLLSIGIDPNKKIYPWKQLFASQPLKTLM